MIKNRYALGLGVALSIGVLLVAASSTVSVLAQKAMPANQTGNSTGMNLGNKTSGGNMTSGKMKTSNATSSANQSMTGAAGNLSSAKPGSKAPGAVLGIPGKTSPQAAAGNMTGNMTKSSAGNMTKSSAGNMTKSSAGNATSAGGNASNSTNPLQKITGAIGKAFTGIFGGKK